MREFQNAILFIFTFYLLLNANICIGQTNYVSGSEITLEVSKNGVLGYVTNIDKGLSIYQLSKTFRMDVDQIYKVNNLKTNAPIPSGTQIFVPVSREQIITQSGFNHQKIAHLRIMYLVKPGETLYRISKVYFGQEVNDVKQRNNLKTDHLAAGDLLFMGYWPLEKTTQAAPGLVNKPNTPQSLEGMQLQNKDVGTSQPSSVQILKDQEVPQLPEEEWVSGQAIGLWDKTNRMTKSMYVLHNDAKIGSEMELFFPLVRSSVRAKVVGRIPEGTYSEDIALYVSPKVARQLGVLDPRFQVNIKYLKSKS